MNLLITGAWQGAPENIKVLEEMGHVVSFLQFEKDKLPCDYKWVEGVICNGLFLHHQIEKFKNLRYIQLTSAGYDRISMEYVKEHNIEIYNARGVYSIPMAEFAIGGVLQLYKHMTFFRANQNHHRWEKHRGLLELFGKTVCIIGCGSVGTECAKRFQAFGCNVVGVDLYSKFDENYKEIVNFDRFVEILPKTDILILTLPLTETSKHLMNSERFALMKQGAILVNIARGALCDGKALEDALDNQIAGAVLDVFEEEPLDENSRLWNMENVLISPHNSFVGEGNLPRLNRVILDNARRICVS